MVDGQLSGAMLTLLFRRATAARDPVCAKRPAYYDPLRIAGGRMKRIVEGTDRGQGTLFPECLDDWAAKPAGAARRG